MNHIQIHKSQLAGSIHIPPSKSMAHRAMICASLAEGTSVITNVLLSDDILATMDMCIALGATIEQKEQQLIIQGRTKNNRSFGLSNESGSTLRFFIPIVKNFYDEFTIFGKPSLLKRPLQEYEVLFPNDLTILDDRLIIKGGLKKSEYVVKGNVSSQFISGLLFVLPLQTHDSTIIIQETLESRSYVLLTIQCLKHFGIQIEMNDQRIHIRGNQQYQPTQYRVEGDYSQAAFFAVANSLGASLELIDLDINSVQGDRVIFDFIQSKSTFLDASDCPDLIPIASIYAASRNGITTHFTNIRRLRIKESNRVLAIESMLKALGVPVEVQENDMYITGVSVFNDATIDSMNDHRIAMSAAIASLYVKNEIHLINPWSVNKSFPTFWEEFSRLGGVYHEF